MADNTTALLKLLRWCEHHPHEPSDKDYKTMYGGGTKYQKSECTVSDENDKVSKVECNP